MMQTSATLLDLVSRYQAFLKEYIYPIEKEIIFGSFKSHLPKLRELRELAKSKCLFTPHLSLDEGGLGLSLHEFARVSEILGTSPLGHYIFNCNAPDIGNMELMHQFASPFLKETFLKPLQRGEIRSCFAMTEPEHAGSNPIHMSTKAVLEGDEYVINGHKWFTTAADGAHFTIVMAITNPEAENV